MCIIWTRPAGTTPIPEAHLNAALNANRDGYGFMAFIDGQLVADKFGPKDRAKFVAAYRAAEATDATIVGHARIGTHGANTRDNAHPFLVTPLDGSAPYLLMHNGILWGLHVKPGESDTRTYAEQVLARLPGEWWDNPALVYLVESDLGQSNKFAILTADGRIVLLNERAGTTEDGRWYSNTSFRPYTSSGWTTHKVATVTTAKGGTAPTPGSKRSQKRQARAERAAARRTMKADNAKATALVKVDSPSLPVAKRGALMLTHGGHPVEVLTEVDREADRDYYESVECTSCGTFGDLFVIDGRAYIDMAHKAPAVVHNDALAAAGIA